MIAARAVGPDFAATPLRLVTLPDFLDPTRADEVGANVFARNDFDEVYGLTPQDEQAWAETKGRHVDRETYFAAPANEHYYRFSSTRTWSYRFGQRSVEGSCPLRIEELRGVLEFVSAITGYPLRKIRVAVLSLGPGDFIGAHHENRLGRLVTAHLPLTRNWSATDGGVLRFSGHDGSEHSVPHRFNSCTIFDVRAHASQRVTPVLGSAPARLLLFWCYP